jgi:hypothetical protein
MRILITTIFLAFTQFTFAQLTGYWLSDVGGCYELRQDGNEIWWIGGSRAGDRPTVVFHGVLAGNIITGRWCDCLPTPGKTAEKPYLFALKTTIDW